MPQSRNVHRKRTKTVIEIRIHLLFRERTVHLIAAGRQNTDINFHRVCVAGTDKSLLLQNFQYPRLQPKRHLRDFIQQDRALLSNLQLAQSLR